jgi:large subunit ribosomal protein L21
MGYAVFQIGRHQFRAEKGARLDLPFLAGRQPGDAVEFTEVLTHREGDQLRIGQPKVQGVRIVAKVIDHGKADKVIVFKFRRREGYHKKKGHRQRFTRVEITDIVAG